MRHPQADQPDSKFFDVVPVAYGAAYHRDLKAVDTAMQEAVLADFRSRSFPPGNPVDLDGFLWCTVTERGTNLLGHFYCLEKNGIGLYLLGIRRLTYTESGQLQYEGFSDLLQEAKRVGMAMNARSVAELIRATFTRIPGQV